MQRTGISPGHWPPYELNRLIDAIYRLQPGLNRQRNVVVQCANCLSYWLVDTWLEAIPCVQLTPYCDQVAYCASCSGNIVDR